jgi:hypothetical protein
MRKLNYCKDSESRIKTKILCVLIVLHKNLMELHIKIEEVFKKIIDFDRFETSDSEKYIFH